LGDGNQSQKSQKSQIIIWRAPGPCGASPTQPYKCGQNVKVKVKTALALAFAEINKLANAEIKKLTLILKY
jgi:hypothetical protein